MPVRTRRMKNSGKGVRLPEGSSSSDEDTEMSPPAKSMVDELRSYLDTRIQERMVAFNENVQTEPPMVQKDDTTQLLLQILNDQNERMKKLEQAVSNTKHFTQNIAAFVQGMSQKNTTRGIEVGQGSGQQPQIEMVTTNVEIPIGYPVNPVIITKSIKVEPPHFEPPRVEPPRMESPRFEPPRVEQPRVEPPRVDPPRVEQPRVEPPRMEQLRFEPPRMEPPRVDPPRFKQPRVEPPRMEPPRFEQPRMEPPRFEQPRMEPPCFEQPRMYQPWFEQPRMEPPRFEPRMEPPWIGQPQFGFSRAEPFQPRIGQPEVGFRVEPPQRFGPIRDEPYREQLMDLSFGRGFTKFVKLSPFKSSVASSDDDDEDDDSSLTRMMLRGIGDS
uniref:Uncharacterized protein n=1 Tax=Fagus sylvatica TaxID=28930 RepID=A0A2N9I538_FAGSY